MLLADTEFFGMPAELGGNSLFDRVRDVHLSYIRLLISSGFTYTGFGILLRRFKLLGHIVSDVILLVLGVL